MGIFDKAKDALGDHPDQVDSGIDKAADFADDRTGGAHAGMFLKIRSAAAFASVTASVMPVISAGRPLAFEKPVKIGLCGLSRRTNSRKLLSGRRV